MFDLKKKLLHSYISRPYDYFLSIDSGEVIRVIGNDTTNTFELLAILIGLYTEAIVSGMLILTLMIITPEVTGCMIVVIMVLLLIITKFIKPVLQKAGDEDQRASAGMNKWLLQAINGIKEIKILGTETYFQSNFNKHGRKSVESLRRAKTLSVAPRFIIEGISMGAMFLVVAFLISQGQNSDSIVPILTAVAMAAIRLLPSVNRISNGVAQVAYNEVRLDKLIENLSELDIEPEDISITKDEGRRVNPRMFSDNIILDNIGFRYPQSDISILENASLRIKKGESVGIVGASGAGKSTLVDILLGLLNPQSGQVKVDGVDISENVGEWHKQIGYIPQMIFMLDDTIKRNVCFGIKDTEIDENQLMKVLKEASLESFVQALPDGIETQIGERGVRLSGGQRQRIGIARALYRNPQLLVLDEATSALDNETEAAVMESINRLQGEKTMIIIAHRLTTIQNCEHIYRVNNGKIYQER